MREKLKGWIVAAAVAWLPSSVFAQGAPVPERGIADIVAALEANDLSASEIRAVVSYERLDVIDLTMLEDDTGFELLEKALDEVDDGWARVQTAVVQNETILEELRRRAVPIRRIEAASRNGRVITIYVR